MHSRSILDPRTWQLQQYAHRNRSELTPSEARLWSALERRQLGVQFRRQVVLADRYIVDFLAPNIRLVVEVDGDSHCTRRRADACRDAQLRELGYHIVRSGPRS